MQCDADTPQQATPVTATGYGIVYNNTPLAPEGPGGRLVVNGSAAGGNKIVPAPISLTNAAVYSMVVGSPCRVDNEVTYMYCPLDQSQSDTATQFIVFAAPSTALGSGTGQKLAPGTSIILKSVQTGKFCIVVSVGPAVQQIICNVTDPWEASAMDYTGVGFSYQGKSFSNFGSNTPLQLGATGMPAALTPGGMAAPPFYAPPACSPHSSSLVANCMLVWLLLRLVFKAATACCFCLPGTAAAALPWPAWLLILRAVHCWLQAARPPAS